MALNEKVNIEIESKAKGDGFKRVNKELNETSKSLDSAKVSLAKFGVVAGGLAIAGITKFLSHSITLGKELKILRDNFEGTSKDIDLFKKATAGTVSEGSLIKLSNYASDLGVSLKDQALLFSLAEDAADKYGGGVEANFEKVIAATDGSAKGLRTVGIAVKDYNKELESLTKSQGINIDKLEANEQLQIRLQAIYNLTGVSIGSVNEKLKDEADIIDSLSTSVTNLVVGFGEGLVSGLSNLLLRVDSLNTSMSDGTVIAENYGYSLGDAIARGIEGVIHYYEKAKEMINWIDTLGGLAENPFKPETFGYERDVINQPSKEEFLLNKENEKKLKEMQRRQLLERPERDLPPTRSGDVKKETEKEIKYLSERFISVSLWNLNNAIQGLLPSYMYDVTSEPGGTEFERQDTLFQRKFRAPELEEVQGIDYGALNQEAMNLNTNITNILSTLGIGTDNFINKMFTGFNTILSLIQNFIQVANAVSGIVGIIKAVGTVATAAGGAAGLRANSGTSGTNAYFRIDLNAMNIVREGNSQLDKYNNAIRVSI